MLKKFLYRIIEWICCFDEYESYGYSGVIYKHKIVKIKSWNWYLVDCVGRQGRAFGRKTVSPIWDWKRIKHLLCRVI